MHLMGRLLNRRLKVRIVIDLAIGFQFLFPVVSDKLLLRLWAQVQLPSAPIPTPLPSPTPTPTPTPAPAPAPTPTPAPAPSATPGRGPAPERALAPASRRFDPGSIGRPGPPPAGNHRTVVLVMCIVDRGENANCRSLRSKVLDSQLQYIAANLKTTPARRAYEALKEAVKTAAAGDVSAAIRQLREINRSRSLSREHGDVQAVASIAEGDLLYYEKQEPAEALKRYGSALDKTRHPYIKAWAHKEIGLVGYASQAIDFGEVKKHLSEAVRASEQVKDAAQRAQILLPIAMIYKLEGHATEARSLVDKAGEICRSQCKQEVREEIAHYNDL